MEVMMTFENNPAAPRDCVRSATPGVWVMIALSVTSRLPIE